MHCQMGSDNQDETKLFELQRRLDELELRLKERDKELEQLRRELNAREEQLQMLRREVDTLGEQCLSLMSESERQIKQLRQLLSLAKQINSSLELKAVLLSILHAAEEVTGAEESSIMLKKEGEELQFEVATGRGAGVLKNISLRLGEGIAGYVAMTGKPLIVNDIAREERHKREVDEMTGIKTRNLIAVPLRLDDEVIGVVEALNKRGGENFDEGDRSDLELLAEFSAIAIDKAKKHEALQELFLSSIRALTAALDARDQYTHGHSERVTRFALAIAEELGMDEASRKRLELSALLHDIGKLGIEDTILKKRDKLTKEEYEQIKAHPEKGYYILKLIRQLEPYLPGVRHHHEHFDGSGYPDGLKGEEIPLDARIIAVADVFDALTSNRPYRSAYKSEEAVEIMRSEVGKYFDPTIFEAFMRAYEGGKIRAQRLKCKCCKRR